MNVVRHWYGYVLHLGETCRLIFYSRGGWGKPICTASFLCPLYPPWEISQKSEAVLLAKNVKLNVFIVEYKKKGQMKLAHSPYGEY